MSPPTSWPRSDRREYTGNIAHPTEKAISVIKPLVETFSPLGGILLDQFSGSGSTSVAAALAGRLHVGIELEEKCCSLAEGRLAGVERFRKRQPQPRRPAEAPRTILPLHAPCNAGA